MYVSPWFVDLHLIDEIDTSLLTRWNMWLFSSIGSSWKFFHLEWSSLCVKSGRTVLGIYENNTQPGVIHSNKMQFDDLFDDGDDFKVSRKKRVGGYVLGSLLGEGSFAKVRLGSHIMTRERVSIETRFNLRCIYMPGIVNYTSPILVIELVHR